MDAQSESCEPPPCEPQPPGKIRKAFKLFGKRKPGSSVASIFSIRGKRDGDAKSPTSRSKTQDGLNEPTAPEAEAEQVDLDQEDESQAEDTPVEEFPSENVNTETTPTRQSMSSLTSAKSLSFLSMLRKGRRTGERQAHTESQRPGKQRKSLKGLFGSVPWRSKEKEDEEENEPGPPLLASRSNSVEIIKENLTLTPGPPPRSVEETEEKQPPASEEGPKFTEEPSKVSKPAASQKNERLSVLLGDISSILTPCGDIAADVEAEWAKASYRMEETGTLKVDNSVISSTTSTRLKQSSGVITTLSPTSSLKPSSTSAVEHSSSSTVNKSVHPSHHTKSAVTIISPQANKTSSSISPGPTTPKSSPVAKPASSSTATPLTKTAPTTALTPNSAFTNEPNLTPVVITKPSISPTKPSRSPKITSETKSPATTSPSSTTEPVTKPSSPSTATLPIVATPVSESFPSATISSTPEFADAPAELTKPTQNTNLAIKHAPTIQESKQALSTSATKPPFSKTAPASAPGQRPKLVTTFGLSTSRNTAPISKPETKQPSGQATKPSIQTTIKSPTVLSTVNTPVLKSPSDTNADLREEQTTRASKKGLTVKPTTLSKIPVSGGGRSSKQHRDSQHNGDEDHSNPTTPVLEDEGLFCLTRDCSSKEALSDVSPDSTAITPAFTPSQEDLLGLSARPPTGAGSSSRESKIPLKHGSTATYHSVQGRGDAARSKIPVSKMPVRRSNNKPSTTAQAAVPQK